MSALRGGRGPARRVACALVIALLAGCGDDATPTAPPSPPQPVPSPILSVTPPARSMGVIYDTGIEVAFGPALDAATLTEQNVFMKLDLQRFPATLNYDPAQRVLRVTPRFTLALRRTYTIEITPRVLTAAGSPVAPGGYFWQFTTNSLRRPSATNPPPVSLNESPFVALHWQATESTAGMLGYEVYESVDSLAVAMRSVARIAAPSKGLYIPRNRRELSRSYFWSVRAINTTTGEQLDSPVYRFDTLPAGTPVDSMVVPLTTWGYFQRAGGGVVFCSPAAIPSSSINFNGALRYGWPSTRTGLRLAGARLTLLTSSFNAQTGRPTLDLVGPWSGCSALTLAVPALDPASELAIGTPGATNSWVRLSSDYMTATVEADARFGDVGGYQLRSLTNFTWSTSAPASPEGGAMQVYYYALPPGAVASIR